MLDMGFAPQIEKILRHLPKQRQTMLFSATMPGEIMSIAARFMKLPVSIEIAPPGTMADKVTQEVFIVKRDSKIKLLDTLLKQYKGSVLLFSRTKHGAHKTARSLKEMGVRCAEIHSDRSLPQRREALSGFKDGRYRVLVATDIAARGIDVTGIELVVNYDLPDDAQNYVHRIGRTARAGKKGHAISFATPDQRQELKDIEKLTNIPLPIARHPDVQHEEFVDMPKQHGGKKGGRGGGGGYGGRPQHGGGGQSRGGRPGGNGNRGKPWGNKKPNRSNSRPSR